ncbi:MAG: tRNA (adenosine(37)-N6)-threonylcarbamoyltransferase complex dimerization subunit type 1 TsaB [Gammaproteobacteria bacterium]
MKQLIALETSGPVCSVAIHAHGAWFEHTQIVERLHNQILLEHIDRVVAAANVSKRAFDVIAFGAGPGSFTGIRLAASAAQALAFSSAARVVPVSSSSALATRCLRALPELHDLVTVTRSRRDAYYLAGWTRTDAGMRQVYDDVLHLGDDVRLPERLSGLTGTGDCPPWWQRGGGGAWVATEHPDAREIGERALVEYAHTGGVTPAAGLPRYVSGDSPWRPVRAS